jgi:DNA-binding NarL/FixJ family response regulator
VSRPSVRCAVCETEIPFFERVAVVPRTQGDMVWVHDRCATRLVADVLQRLHRDDIKRERRGDAARRLGLSPQDERVLECIAHGQTDKQIAVALGITHKSARNAVSRVLAKLDARNRAEAVGIATREGLIET